MANNVFTKDGGHVQYIPPRVLSDDAAYTPSMQDNIRSLALERDLTAANLLETDVLLDMLDAAIDDQMKNFALTVPELADAAANLCGNPTVTWECYKKAKELLRIAPWIAYGYDPVQLTFTDQFVRRAGNVVFDCKQFDPNTFQKDGYDPMADVNADLGLDASDTQSPSAIEAAAQDNQKKWSLLMLFWDLLWGKSKVKKNISDSQAFADDIELINKKINELNAKSQDVTLNADGTPLYTEEQKKGFGDLAATMSTQLAQAKSLPNTIMKDRPRWVSELVWVGQNDAEIETNFNTKYTDPSLGFTSTQDGIPYITLGPEKISSGYPWADNSVAVWVDFASLFSDSGDRYADKSVPSIASGFLLAILVGFFSLPPKVCFYFIMGRFEFLRQILFLKNFNIKIIKKIYLLRPIYYLLKYVINLIIGIPIAINTIFIEVAIWFALMPHKYMPNVSDIHIPKIVPNNTNLNDSMIVNPTPAGFISMDCFTAAQQIVNRVNAEAVN